MTTKEKIAVVSKLLQKHLGLSTEEVMGATLLVHIKGLKLGGSLEDPDVLFITKVSHLEHDWTGLNVKFVQTVHTQATPPYVEGYDFPLDSGDELEIQGLYISDECCTLDGKILPDGPGLEEVFDSRFGLTVGLEVEVSLFQSSSK